MLSTLGDERSDEFGSDIASLMFGMDDDAFYEDEVGEVLGEDGEEGVGET